MNLCPAQPYGHMCVFQREGNYLKVASRTFYQLRVGGQGPRGEERAAFLWSAPGHCVALWNLSRGIPRRIGLVCEHVREPRGTSRSAEQGVFSGWGGRCQWGLSHYSFEILSTSSGGETWRDSGDSIITSGCPVPQGSWAYILFLSTYRSLALSVMLCFFFFFLTFNFVLE